jgi:hypothetical protein
MKDFEQRHASQRKNHQAYLWPGSSVVFDFRVGREREGPKRTKTDALELLRE